MNRVTVFRRAYLGKFSSRTSTLSLQPPKISSSRLPACSSCGMLVDQLDTGHRASSRDIVRLERAAAVNVEIPALGAGRFVGNLPAPGILVIVDVARGTIKGVANGADMVPVELLQPLVVFVT